MVLRPTRRMSCSSESIVPSAASDGSEMSSSYTLTTKVCRYRRSSQVLGLFVIRSRDVPGISRCLNEGPRNVKNSLGSKFAWLNLRLRRLGNSRFSLSKDSLTALPKTNLCDQFRDSSVEEQRRKSVLRKAEVESILAIATGLPKVGSRSGSRR